MLQFTFADMSYFVSLFLFIVLTFALLYKIQGQEKFMTAAESTQYSLQQLGSSYQIVFGENPDPKEMGKLGWIIYFLMTMLLNIVTLNLLIAIISNTYDKVQASMDAYHCKTKADILLELSSFMIGLEDNEEDLEYLYIFRYSSEKLGAAESQEEWQGRMKAMNKKLQSLDDAILGQMNDIDEKIMANGR